MDHLLHSLITVVIRRIKGWEPCADKLNI